MNFEQPYVLFDGTEIPVSDLSDLSREDREFLADIAAQADAGQDYYALSDQVSMIGAYPLKGAPAPTPEIVGAVLYRIAADLVQRAGHRQGRLAAPRHFAARQAGVPPDDVVTVIEAANILKCSRGNVMHLLRGKKLTGRKVEGNWLIDRVSVDQLERRRPSHRRDNATGAVFLIYPRDVWEQHSTPANGLIQKFGEPNILNVWTTPEYGFAHIKARPRDLRAGRMHAEQARVEVVSLSELPARRQGLGLDKISVSPERPKLLLDLRNSNTPVWRFRSPRAIAFQPFIAHLARRYGLSYSVLHAVIVGSHAYVDVVFGGDEPRRIDVLREEHALMGGCSDLVARKLEGRPSYSVWCDDLRRDFEDAVGNVLSIGAGQKISIQDNVHGGLVTRLVDLIERSYCSYVGVEELWYWLNPDNICHVMQSETRKKARKRDLKELVRKAESEGSAVTGLCGLAKTLSEFSVIGWAMSSLPPNKLDLDLVRRMFHLRHSRFFADLPPPQKDEAGNTGGNDQGHNPCEAEALYM